MNLSWLYALSVLLVGFTLPIFSYLTLIYRELGRMTTGRVHEHLEIINQFMKQPFKLPEGYTLNPDGTVTMSQEVQAANAEVFAAHFAQEKLLKSYSLWTLDQRQNFPLKVANPYVQYAAQNPPVDLTVYVSFKRGHLPGRYQT